MSQQMEQLAVLDVLPEDLEQREFVINRALDVRSATMLFLALNIRHDSTFLGIPGILSLRASLIHQGKLSRYSSQEMRRSQIQKRTLRNVWRIIVGRCLMSSASAP